MAELHEIIGGVLRDLAQSRIASDIHSREASLAYQKDPILRKFPVPRVDIKEAEVDLRFAVANIERQDEIEFTEGVDYLAAKRTQLLARVFERYSSEISEQVADDYYKELKEIVADYRQSQRENKNQIDELWQSSQLQINSRSFRESIAEIVLDELESYTQEQINEKLILKDVHEKNSVKKILDAVKEYLAEEVDEELLSVLTDKENTRVFLEVNKTIQRKIREMKNTILWLSQDDLGVNIDVDVSAERLENKTPELVSSIKLKVDIRNYVWTQTEERDGKVVRQLVPE